MRGGTPRGASYPVGMGLRPTSKKLIRAGYRKQPPHSKMKRTLTVSPTTYKKGKYARQRLRGRRVPRPLATKYHNFVRSVSTTGNSLAYDEYLGFSTAVKDLQFSFQLSGVTVYLAGVTWLQLGMPNYTELTALYDQYRIDWVECEFYFSNNYSTVNVPESPSHRVFSEGLRRCSIRHRPSLTAIRLLPNLANRAPATPWQARDSRTTKRRHRRLPRCHDGLRKR